MSDQLIICPHCGGDACYKKQVSMELSTYFCYGCGFQTNSLMKEGEEFYEEQLKTLPELYKDLKYKDHEGMIWIPAFISTQGKGTIFVKGTNTEEWGWSAMKHRKIEDHEKELFKNPNGEYYDYTTDTKTLKTYNKKDFIEALDYIGAFEKEENED